jgi:glucose/arabinose dehydrogenase
VPVTGGEMLAWEYAGALDSAEPPGWVAYVDDRRVMLAGVMCEAPESGLARTCRSRLPALAPGAHTIQVAAVVARAGQVFEGVPSSSIRVRFNAPAQHELAAADRVRETVTADGVHLRAEMIASGLSDPTDLAVLPDGGALIAERSGRILQCRAGVMQEHSAAQLRDIATGDGRGLLTLAVDLDFEKTRTVYALYTATDGARLVRMIDDGRGFGSPAVLLDGLPLAPVDPAASLRMGPDRKLYLALDDGGQPARAEDWGSYSGKVLRLNPDGTTPRDQPQHSPVFAAGFHRPGGFTWESGSRLLMVSGDAADSEQLLSIASEHAGRGEIESRFALPTGAAAGGIIYYESSSVPAFQGNVFITGGPGSGLLRVSSSDRPIEWLFRETIDPLGTLALGRDGAIYALTSNALWRISSR